MLLSEHLFSKHPEHRCSPSEFSAHWLPVDICVESEAQHVLVPDIKGCNQTINPIISNLIGWEEKSGREGSDEKRMRERRKERRREGEESRRFKVEGERKNERRQKEDERKKKEKKGGRKNL